MRRLGMHAKRVRPMLAAADAPSWVQYIIVAAGGVGVFVGTVYSYIKKGKQASAGSEVAVVSAAFADRRTVEVLADALERLERSTHELCEESRRTRYAIEQSTDAQVNMLRFMKGRGE